MEDAWLRPHILSIDPGLTTGWVAYDLEDPTNSYSCELDAKARGRLSSVFIGEEFSLWVSLYRKNLKLVVCEDWEFRHTGFAVDAKHAAGPIGVLEYLCAQEDIPLVLVKPMLRSRITDPVLKKSGLWWPHGQGHARQAMKHVLAYQLRQQDRATQEMLYPRGDVR